MVNNMKIRRLYIGDVGIYRNALMEDIAPNVVVIGGLNRAGKTTLLEVLRHLVYGLPKNLRDTKVEYNVESDFINENNEDLTIRISGLKEPQVTCNKEKVSFPSSELYKGIDKFTYSKLFTITLDELRKSNVKEEEEKIKAILLGAGLEEVAKIPKLIDNFSKAREKLGGKQGNPKTKLFKPYYEKLMKGIQEKDAALKQLEEYKAASDSYKDYDEEVKANKKLLRQLENKLIVLEVLKTNYESYKEKLRLQLELGQYKQEEYWQFEGYPSLDRLQAAYNEYLEALKSYEKLKEGTVQSVSYEKIIKNKEKLAELLRNQSGLKQRIENYNSEKRLLQEEKERLIAKMNSLNHEWKGDFSRLKAVNCDFLEESKLQKLVGEIKKQEEQQDRIKWELEEQKSQKDRVGKELNALKSGDLNVLIYRYLFIAVLFILGGAGIAFINKFIGAAISLAGVVLAAFYMFLKYNSINGSAARRKVLEIELNSLQNKITSLEERAASFKEVLGKLYSDLEGYKRPLSLTKELSASDFYTYYKGVQELKINIGALEGRVNKLEVLKDEIIEELLILKAFLEIFYDLKNINISRDNILAYSEKLFNAFSQLAAQLEKAENYIRLEKSYLNIKEKTARLFQIEESSAEILDKLYSILEKYKDYNEYKNLKTRIELIDRTINQSFSSNSFKSALEDNHSDYKEAGENYEVLFEEYSSVEDLNRHYSSCEEEGHKLKDKLEDLGQKLQRVKIELEALRTSEKIKEAQKSIDEGRAGMEPLAVKYAVYSAAEYILSKVQQSFIDNAKDSLLSGASSILNKITSGEYKSILPGDNLLMSDFKTITKEEEENNSYDTLSRGTGEQIFLAVRLNRIMETEAKLPIILDDPFVNFDSLHTKNTLEVIKDLSRENQIFILTCHPEVVEAAQSTLPGAQYWKLDKGSFELTNGDSLTNYLSKSKLEGLN
jgi:uncharacterized protein YhaN